jgi:hypothetical protein
MWVFQGKASYRESGYNSLEAIGQGIFNCPTYFESKSRSIWSVCVGWRTLSGPIFRPVSICLDTAPSGATQKKFSSFFPGCARRRHFFKPNGLPRRIPLKKSPQCFTTKVDKAKHQKENDVYARVCSCRQCWASKCRGL